jgi:hypothetical protein
MLDFTLVLHLSMVKFIFICLYIYYKKIRVGLPLGGFRLPFFVGLWINLW